MNFDLVWNDNVAENFRQDAVAAMQGTTYDMIRVAEDFIREAAQKDERANQLARQMPVMRWVERLIPNDGTNDEFSQQTEWVQVVDTNATARRQAEIDLLREKAESLRDIAEQMKEVAEELKRMIASTNALFYELHEHKTSTDNRYAGNLDELMWMIEDYIRRIGELRDSFGNNFTTAADGVVYFGSSSSSILNNPNSFAGAHAMFGSGNGAVQSWFAGLNNPTDTNTDNHPTITSEMIREMDFSWLNELNQSDAHEIIQSLREGMTVAEFMQVIARADELRIQANAQRAEINRQRADLSRDLANSLAGQERGGEWIRNSVNTSLPLPPQANGLPGSFNAALLDFILPWIEFDEQFPALSDYRRMSREQLAQEILNRPGIDLNPSISSDVQERDLRTPRDNIYHTSQGEPVRTRPHYEIEGPISGRTPVVDSVFLSRYLLETILLLNDEFGSIQINAIAGLNHDGGRSDEHIRGMAIDMTRIRDTDTGHFINSDIVFDSLHNQGFVTQRNRRFVMPDALYFTTHRYYNFLTQNLHLSIYGHETTLPYGYQPKPRP